MPPLTLDDSDRVAVYGLNDLFLEIGDGEIPWVGVFKAVVFIDVSRLFLPHGFGGEILWCTGIKFQLIQLIDVKEVILMLWAGGAVIISHCRGAARQEDLHSVIRTRLRPEALQGSSTQMVEWKATFPPPKKKAFRCK